MKKRKNISLGLIVVFLLALTIGCEEFLDLKPYDALTAEQLLLDEEGMQGLANPQLQALARV